MGCSASKSQTDASGQANPVKTIEVKESVAEKDSNSQEVRPGRDSNERGLSSRDKTNDETEANEDGRNGKIAPPQIQFVEREENEGGAENDVTLLKEIVGNSLSKNVQDFIKILGSVSYAHRQLIRKKYQDKHDEDLLDKVILSDEVILETALKCIVRNQAEFLSYFMHQSIKRKDYKTLAEILTAWPSALVAESKRKYKEDRRVEFSEDVTNSLGEKLSEDQRSLLISLSSLERNNDSKELEEDVINDECGELSQGAGSIVDILSTKPYSLQQLNSIFQQFKSKYYLDITESIDIEFQDEITETVLKTIAGITLDTPYYFATQLNNILSKASVDKERLLFIVVGRQPVDMFDVNKKYNEITSSSLEDAVKAQSKNHFGDLILLTTKRSVLM